MDTVTLQDGRTVKLGRIRPRSLTNYGRFIRREAHDGSVKFFSRLGIHHDSADATNPIPASVDWTAKGMASIERMYLNDTIGDCVIAGKYHIEGVASGNESGTVVLGTDAEVSHEYTTICGAGDNGCDIATVMDYWQKTGLTFNGVNKKIAGYVAVDWTNKALVQTAIYLFGNLTLGINLPNAWKQTNTTWDVTTSQIIGGHDVPAFGYGLPAPVLTSATKDGVVIATWAGLVQITWAAFLSRKWIEECYAALPVDWTANANLAPNGVNAMALAADLQLIANGQVPPIPGPVPPPPPPPPPPPSGIARVILLDKDGNTIQALNVTSAPHDAIMLEIREELAKFAAMVAE